MVKVSFYGASGEVTGSNFLVETDEHKYVVDCGLFQGGETIPADNAKPFVYEPSKVDAVIITHAHLDHIGRLPKLVSEGFRGPIYATAATAELTKITLKDALNIMDYNTKRHGQPALYSEVDLNRTLALFQPIPYHQPQPLFGKDSVTLFDAGHILGSASVLLEAGGKKLIFSGDIGYYPNTLLPHPETPHQADIVITEGTYGGVEREKTADRLSVLKEAVEWTIHNNGVLLIPAFSIERSQELLYLFHYLYTQHQLPRLPIYFDSPLAIEALEVFERHQDMFTKSVEQFRSTEHDVFTFGNLALTSSVDQSKSINNAPTPKIIIAGSGMMAGGRIMHHLKRYISHPNTLLLVVGYQAEGTLGRKIVDGAKQIHLEGEEIPVHAKIEVVDIFSGHADNDQLLEWIKQIQLSPSGKIAIVHSDPSRAAIFQQELAKLLPGAEVLVAKIGDVVEL